MLWKGELPFTLFELPKILKDILTENYGFLSVSMGNSLIGGHLRQQSKTHLGTGNLIRYWAEK
jgi:hypothetical protein